MASTTGFLGLQKLEAGDAMSQNDYAFSNRNMDIIDRLLHKFDEAIFSGVSPLEDPTDPPSLEASTSDGVIPGGRTIRYKYTYVDAYGNESAASPEATITTSTPVTRPGQASLSNNDSGGNLLAGNYFYILSAYVDVNTSETNGGAAATINVPTGSTNAITLTLPSLPSGASGFNIFRRGPGEVQFYYLDSVDMSVATPPSTYIDDNSITINNSRTPSATNLTSSSNSIAISLPGATPYVPDGYTWKVYRSFVSGNYDNSTLEWVVTETYSGSGIITPTAYDYGGRTTVGQPPTVSSITADTSRIASLETDVNAIEAELGVIPQGSYDTVAQRLDDIEPEIVVLSSDITFTTDTLDTTISNITLTSGASAFLLEGQFFVSAPASEGFQFEMFTITNDATPSSMGTMLFQVDPSSMATPDPTINSPVYEESDPVAIDGSASTQGVIIHGSLVVTDSSKSATLYIRGSQFNTPATPAGSILKKGSWFRVTKVH